MLGTIINQNPSKAAPVLTRTNNPNSEYIQRLRAQGKATCFEDVKEVGSAEAEFDLALVESQTVEGHPLPGMAVVRADDRTAFRQVGDTFKLIQPRDLLNVANEIRARTGAKLSQCRALKHGRHIAITLVLPGEETIGRDVNLKTVRIFAANDGTGSAKFEAIAHRLWCRNAYQMVISGSRAGNSTTERTVRIWHTESGVDVIKTAGAVCNFLLPSIDAFRAEFERLVARPVSRPQLSDFYRLVAPPPAHPGPGASEEAMKKYDRACAKGNDRVSAWTQNFLREVNEGFPASAWLAVNSVTEWAQHQYEPAGWLKNPEAREYAVLPGGTAYAMTAAAREAGLSLLN